MSLARRLVLALLFVLLGRSTQAQEMEIPVAIQISLFLKVVTFDRQANGSPVMGIVHQSGNAESVRAKTEALKALSGSGVRAVVIDLDRESLTSAIQRERPTLIYVTPLRAVDVRKVAELCRSSRVKSFTGVPQYVVDGLSVGVRLQGDRPRLLVNLSAARDEGADYRAELLKLAQLVEG